MNRKKIILLTTGFLVALFIISVLPTTTNTDEIYQDEALYPRSSASLEGVENVIVTKINREANISGFGLVNIEDKITFKNLNNNPINYVFIGIPEGYSEELVYFEATEQNKGTLLAERSYLVMDDKELITIYFDSPLLPYQSKEIIFRQSYNNMVEYSLSGQSQIIQFNNFIFPLLPYSTESNVKSIYQCPESSTLDAYGWGSSDPDNSIEYDLNQETKPFLNNLADDKKKVQITFTDNTLTKLEVSELTREIYISTWGIIQVKEDYAITNRGAYQVNQLNFKIPGPAKEVQVYDDLSDVLGITLNPESNYTNLETKDLEIDLSENRVQITPNSSYRFTIEYFLPYEKYISFDWFRISLNIDLLTTTHQFLVNAPTNRIIIDGAANIESITEEPDTIESNQGRIVLEFNDDFITPLQTKTVQFTYYVNYINLILRPLVFILLCMTILTLFVLRMKSKKPEEEIGVFMKESLPIREIREITALYDEKNALLMEIRQAEEDARRRKIVKKKYRSIVNKNTSKIEEIEEEIKPFKKKLSEESAELANILHKIELLEAERISVKDGLTLLEARYKRGKLPSKRAYEKLSGDFERRLKKIDRSIDKLVQQLRSFLL